MNGFYFYAITILVLACLYFMSDLENLASIFSSKKEVITTAEKFAKLALISNDASSIKNFIISNVKWLSPEIIDQLICRIESLEADQIINDHNLKTRIDTEKMENIPVEQASKSRTKRK